VEAIHVTDGDRALVAPWIRTQAYGSTRPQILVTFRLALPTQLVEVRFVAKLQ
jgi:hypothetical protein